MKILDCFMFFNEIEILKLRLTELYEIVDFFIIAESSCTFSGIDKEFNFEKNKNIYENYLDKIIYIKVDDMPFRNDFNKSSWLREGYQRRCLERGINSLELEDEDIIIFTDCDEIPDPNLIKKIKLGEIIIKDINKLNQVHHIYNLEYIDTNYDSSLPKILTFKKYKLFDNIDKIRYYTDCEYLTPGGWHFSYFGNYDKLVEKIKSYSHQEHNKEEILNKDKMLKRIKNKIPIILDTDYTKIKYLSIQDNNYLPEHYDILESLCNYGEDSSFFESNCFM